jgi:iron(III) transport system ATP-binding protein
LTGQTLRFVDVSCQFGSDVAVNQVSFEINDGEIVCLLGPSGCGKTTCLRLAGGMETLSGGEIWLNGQCVATPRQSATPESRGIGFLFQDFALFPHLSVAENVSFGIEDLPKADKQARVAMLLEAVGLVGFGDKFPDTLSGGEQQRAALARALAPQPKLVLMDEPFSSLDPQLRDQMRDLTVRLLKQSHAAGLIVTHDAADALRMADRVAVQNQGRLIQISTPEDIYTQPQSLEVATMFGPINQIDGTVTNHQLSTELGACALPVADGSYNVGLRPESLSLEAGAGDGLAFEAEVSAVRAIGADWLCDIAVSGLNGWQAVLRQSEKPTLGPHKFYVSARRLMVFSK